MQTRKQKIITHIAIVAILCVPAAFLWYAVLNADNSVSYETEFFTVTEPCVYVTTYGKRYHSAGCSYLTKSQHAMGKQLAISKGYTACSRCGGISSGTVEVTYTKKTKVESEPKRIREPIILSLVLTPTIYFFIYFLLTKLLKNYNFDKPLF